MILVVGAGFSGSIVARALADAGIRVVVIDKRPHIGGNAYDRLDEHGILIHPYGPHVFHTNSLSIWEYLCRFTKWRPYEQRALASVDGALVPIPINQTTLVRLYGIEPTEQAAHDFLERAREPRAPLLTSEDIVLNAVGRDLCDKFFRGYTRKQWGLDLSELSPGVTARIPTRVSTDDRYFTDTYQGVPYDGYTQLFENLLDHRRITVYVNTPYRPEWSALHTVWTGPIDEYFDRRLGPLPYRSLRFSHVYKPVKEWQPVAAINYPHISVPFTRCTEFKHITGQEAPGTSICYEYPSADGDPYYPIPRPANAALYHRYREMADRLAEVTFVGRLAQYRYYNMDQAVGAALTAAKRLIG